MNFYIKGVLIVIACAGIITGFFAYVTLMVFFMYTSFKAIASPRVKVVPPVENSVPSELPAEVSSITWEDVPYSFSYERS